MSASQDDLDAKADAIRQFANGYLDKRGWFASLDGVPRNKDGPVPWITYPAFRQLARIVKPDWRVFEYGCGGSSLWWAARARKVFSVEHDPAWAERIAAAAPSNLSIVTRTPCETCASERYAAVEDFMANPPDLPLFLFPEYSRMHGLTAKEFVAYATEICVHPDASFDAIVVDGMARTLCAWLAPRFLKPDGVVIFDNSDRWQYNAAYRLLSANGFKRIDFYGPGPVSRNEWCTSFFVHNLEMFAANIESPRGDSELSW
jgi:SAM-dependent methyltransferase